MLSNLLLLHSPENICPKTELHKDMPRRLFTVCFSLVEVDARIRTLLSTVTPRASVRDGTRYHYANQKFWQTG